VIRDDIQRCTTCTAPEDLVAPRQVVPTLAFLMGALFCDSRLKRKGNVPLTRMTALGE